MVQIKKQHLKRILGLVLFCGFLFSYLLHADSNLKSAKHAKKIEKKAEKKAHKNEGIRFINLAMVTSSLRHSDVITYAFIFVNVYILLCK